MISFFLLLKEIKPAWLAFISVVSLVKKPEKISFEK